MMPHSLPAILEHIRQQNRPNSHGAVLVREIERLTREVASLRATAAAAPTQSVLTSCQEPA